MTSRAVADLGTVRPLAIAALILALVMGKAGRVDSEQPPSSPAAGSTPSSSTASLNPGATSARAGGEVGTASPPSVRGQIQFAIGQGNVVRVGTLSSSTTVITAVNVPNIDKMEGAALASYAATLALTDMGAAHGAGAAASVAFGRPELMGRSGASGLMWRVPVTAKGVAEGTSHLRLASATLVSGSGVETYAFEYTISAKPVTSPQWAVRGAGDVWTVSWSDDLAARVYAITIENQDVPLSNVRIAQSTLRDAAGRALGVERLDLVERPDGQAIPGTDVAANATKTVFLRLNAAEGGGRYGTFDGAVRFAADGGPTLKDVTLKVQASSVCIKSAGIASALAGLLLAWAVAARLRPRLARLQAMRPVVALRQAITRFRAEVRSVCKPGASCAGIDRTAGFLDALIADDALEDGGFLPPHMGLGADPPLDSAAALKARLDEVSSRLSGLMVLLRSGVARLIPLLEGKDRDTALTLIRELDAYADSTTGVQDARIKVEEVLKKRLAATAKESVARSAERPLTVKEIDYLIHNVADVTWAIWALTSLVIAAAWVVSDVDYGTPIDLVSSFAWGFGLTTFGASIQSITPASVGTQLNIKLPK